VSESEEQVKPASRKRKVSFDILEADMSSPSAYEEI
jgi:hypothetical protein